MNSARLILFLIASTALMSGCGGSQTVGKIVVGPSPDFANPGFEFPNIGAGNWDYEPNGFVWTGTTSGQSQWGMCNQATSWGTAHYGSQYALLQGPSTLFQTVSGLTIGNTYLVTFWSCTRNGDVGANTTEPLSVLAEGATIMPAFNPSGPGQWTFYKTNAFTATSTSVTVTFQTQDPTLEDATDLLDDVHLVEVK